jgi:hypothetical protein
MEVKQNENCTMTNVMHMFLIHLSIYFCSTCFGLSFSPSSEAGVQIRQWFKSPGYGVSARGITLCFTLVITQFSFQNAWSSQHKQFS